MGCTDARAPPPRNASGVSESPLIPTLPRPRTALLGNLAWHLVTRTERSIFFEKASHAPHTAGWDTLVWRGCLDTAARELGAATGPPFTIAEGMDRIHKSYVVKARRYERGLAVVRNRGAWDEGLGPETAVTVKLPFPMSPLLPSGLIASPVTEIRINWPVRP